MESRYQKISKITYDHLEVSVPTWARHCTAVEWAGFEFFAPNNFVSREGEGKFVIKLGFSGQVLHNQIAFISATDEYGHVWFMEFREYEFNRCHLFRRSHPISKPVTFFVQLKLMAGRG